MTVTTIIATLDPTPAQRAAIDATMEAFASACNVAVAVGRETETTSNVVLHRFCYHTLRHSFGLSANLAIRAIAHAARRLKNQASSCSAGASEYRISSADEEANTIDYDARTLSIQPDARAVSLSTIAGRIRDVPLRLDAEQGGQLKNSRVVRAMLRRPQRGCYMLEIGVVPRSVSTLPLHEYAPQGIPPITSSST